MLDQISNDIKSAMKEKNKEKLDALRMLKASLIENKTAKKPIAESDVAIGHYKKLRASIEQFPAGSPQIEKIENELAFLKPYLPEQLEEQDVLKMIEELKAENPDGEFSQIMKQLMPRIKGKFDGKKATELVKSSF